MTWAPNRRGLLAGGAAAIPTFAMAPKALGQAKFKVAVVGGGFGGATAARTLSRLAPKAEISLIEPNRQYIACPFSNLVIGGQRTLAQQTFSYAALEKKGISLIHDPARDIDVTAKTLTTNSGRTLRFDKLILSPGIDIRWDALEGYDQASAQLMPHAWKAGPQTELLRQKLCGMEDGGLVVMSVPPAPYRCPPGPYERASLIAHYLKMRKPRSKLLILDAKTSFSKMPLFLDAWQEHYPDHLEWRGVDNDGRVSRVDAESSTVHTDFEAIKADVANVIPPQQAGAIAGRAGIADATGWCPVDPVSFASKLAPDIHVLGDATIAAPMPKSAFSASLQAKICAIAIARELAGLQPEPTILANTCYSYVTPEEAVSISGVYSNADDMLGSIAGAGGISPLGAPSGVRAAEAMQAEAWFQTVTHDAFG